MADPAVALGIQPYSMQQGLGNLSSILGLKQQQVQLAQQQQALQTGQALQQSAQAKAQQDQMAIQQQQQLQQVLKTGIRPDTGQSIYNDNNEVDPDKVTDYATKNLSIIGQGVAQNVLKTKTDKIALSSASADLQD